MKKIGLSPVLIAVVLFAVALVAEAQQPKETAKNRWVVTGFLSASTGNLEAFRKELIALGYVEGKNIEILYRYAEGKPERLPELASELISYK